MSQRPPQPAPHGMPTWAKVLLICMAVMAGTAVLVAVALVVLAVLAPSSPAAPFIYTVF